MLKQNPVASIVSSFPHLRPETFLVILLRQWVNIFLDHHVGNEICSGTERENFKPGTTGTESTHTNEKDTTDNATHT